MAQTFTLSVLPTPLAVKSRFRRRSAGLLLAGLLALNLVACAKVRVEDDPSEQAKATALAEKYVKAFAEGNGPLVLEMSSTPFWGDGVVLPTQSLLETELKDQLKDIQGIPFVVKGVRFVPMTELKAKYPALFENLTKAKFSTDIYAVQLTVQVKNKPEDGIVLLRRDEAGVWSVAGIGD